MSDNIKFVSVGQTGLKERGNKCMFFFLNGTLIFFYIIEFPL